jgi:hypothetical protein
MGELAFKDKSFVQYVFYNTKLFGVMKKEITIFEIP